MNYGAGGAEPDPDLVVLDAEPSPSANRSRRRGRQRERRESGTSAEHLDPTAALANGETDQATATADGPGRISTHKRRSVRSRRKNSRRREIVATVAVTAFVMFLVVLLVLTGSCSSGTDVRTSAAGRRLPFGVARSLRIENRHVRV